jgi:hypothetical protein
VILEILPAGGIGRGEPIVLNASQILIKDAVGNPIMVAGYYGPEGGLNAAALFHDSDEFHDVLRMLGIDMTVILRKLQLPGPPQGARLVSGPKRKTR